MRTPTLATLFAATRIVLIALIAPTALAKPVQLHCELGQQVAVGGDVGIDRSIELHWKGKQYRMKRVRTSTGAQRFEDRDNGLVWISIPDKGMLLDSANGEPLVNECRIAATSQLTK